MKKSCDIASQRLDWANKALSECRLCPRDCRVNRIAEKLGWCGAGAQVQYYKEFVHYGEEPDLSPSHTVYLKHCNLQCLFCHTACERNTAAAIYLTPNRLKEIVEHGRSRGARNLNILGGEPMVNLPGLLKIFAEVETSCPIIWNTNLYCSETALELVAGIPDVYLADLKFGNAVCAKKLADSDDYWDVVRTRLIDLESCEGKNKIIVRHLVMPGHIECCTRPVLEWMAKKLTGVRLSLGLNYLVMPGARNDPHLKRFLTESERFQAEKIANTLGLHLVQRGNPSLYRDMLAHNEGGYCFDDVDFILSPDGRIFVQHPTRGATDLALNVAENYTESNIP